MSKFKLGDYVSVLDDDLSGTIIRLDKSVAYIETKDGFEIEFPLNTLIKIESENFENKLFLSTSVKEAIAEKETSKKKRINAIKPKERFLPTMEVDLHIHQLTKPSKQMSKYDMLNLQIDTAERQLKFAIQKRIQKMVFIHGVGEGVLKLELQYLFDRYNNIKHYDADYQKYGLGATEVYIYQNTKL